jgi:hypothetical protein
MDIRGFGNNVYVPITNPKLYSNVWCSGEPIKDLLLSMKCAESERDSLLFSKKERREKERSFIPRSFDFSGSKPFLTGEVFCSESKEESIKNNLYPRKTY